MNDDSKNHSYSDDDDDDEDSPVKKNQKRIRRLDEDDLADANVIDDTTTENLHPVNQGVCTLDLLQAIEEGNVQYILEWLSSSFSTTTKTTAPPLVTATTTPTFTTTTTMWNGQALLLDDTAATSWQMREKACGLLPNSMSRISLLHVAVGFNRTEIVQIFLQHVRKYYQQRKQHDAHFPDNAEAEDDHLELYASGHPKQDMQTPLWLAVARDTDPEIAKLLLHAGAKTAMKPSIIPTTRVRPEGHIIKPEERDTSLWMICAIQNSVTMANFLWQYCTEDIIVDDDTDTAFCERLREQQQCLRQQTDAQNSDGKTALMYSMEYKSLQMVQWLLHPQRNIDVNVADHRGETALHHYSYRPHKYGIQVLDLLLQRRVNVNAKSSTGTTPLMIALSTYLPRPHPTNNVERDHMFQTIQTLLQHGALVDVEDNNGVTPLQCARDMERIQLILQTGWINVHHRNQAGETALHAACRSKSRKAKVLYLLEFGANPDLPEPIHGRTPLHYAALSGQNSAFDALLDHGANVLARCQSTGRTPVHELVWVGDYRQGQRPGLLRKAISSNSEILRAVDNRGWTLLHWAAFAGYAEAVDILLEHDMRLLHAVDARGRTPLHLACMGFFNPHEWKDAVDIADKIMTTQHTMSDHDWDELRSQSYSTPCGWYVTNSVSTLLLEKYRASPLAEDNDGNLPLLMAAIVLGQNPHILDTLYLHIRAGAHTRLCSRNK